MKKFLIPLNGLTAGHSEYRWTAGKEFFEEFGNSDILDADLEIRAAVEKSGQYVGIDCHIAGELTVECDRCLGRLVLPVDSEIRMSIKFGAEETESAVFEEDGREVVYLAAEDADMDLGQTVYDYSCLAVPLHKVHDEGECDISVLKHLGKEAVESPDSTGPFAVLRDLMQS